MGKGGPSRFDFTWTWKPEKETTLSGTGMKYGGPEVAARVMAERIESSIEAAFKGELGTGLTAKVGSTSVKTIVEEALRNKEHVEGSASSFWYFYMMDEYRKAALNGENQENILGDAGTHGYQVDLNRDQKVVSSENLALKLANASQQYIDQNQQNVKEVFEQAKSYGKTKIKSFESRFDSDENMKEWLKVLGEFRHEKNGRAYKDLEIEFRDGKLQRRSLSDAVTIRRNSESQNGKEEKIRPVISIVQISQNELDFMKRNRRIKLPNGEASVIYLVTNGISNTPSRVEQYFGHFPFDEDQSWEFFNTFIANELKEIVSESWNPKTEIFRSSRIKDKNGEWIQYTTADEFELDTLENDLTKMALNVLDKQDRKVSLSELFNLAWLLNNPEALSTNICVNSRKTAGLQFAHVPRIRQLDNLYKYFKSNFSNFVADINVILSRQYTEIEKPLKSISEDMEKALEGASMSAVLFTYIPERYKNLLRNFFSQSNALISEGGMQTSFVSHPDATIPNVTFVTADNKNTRASISRISAVSPDFRKSVRYVYRNEFTKKEYAQAKEKVLLYSTFRHEEDIQNELLKKAKTKTKDLKDTLIDLCFMLAILELNKPPKKADSDTKTANLSKVYFEIQSRKIRSS